MARPRLAATLVVTALLLIACNGSDDPSATSPPSGPTTTDGTDATDVTEVTEPVTTTTDPTPSMADAATLQAIELQLDASLPGCDALDTRSCVLPFPSDVTTIDDPSSETGLRVSFPDEGLPANADGVSIDPAAWNLLDGFSANSPILTWVPGLDPAASALPAWTDLQSSLDAEANVVVVDQATGNRVPLWAETDADSSADDGELLVVHPAISLEPSTTYSVGIRGLVAIDGAAIEPSAMFRAIRDDLGTTIAAVEDRRGAMDTTFEALEGAGMPRDDVQMAWTFTTASVADTTDAILHMRNETLDSLAGAAPLFGITSVTDNPEPGLARLVEGSYTIPNWMTADGSPGTSLNIGADGLPELNGVVTAPFACEIADTVFNGTEPAHAVIYGHGLLGSHLEVDAGNIVAMSNEHNALYCATKWAGFSEDDVPTAISALQDFSMFAPFIDRMSQGFMNQLVLGRLMLADDGLVNAPEFRRADGSAMLDNSTLVYDGNSQGGIMGMALAAISTDFERAVFGVVGMNYSTLLPRSVDFDDFKTIFVPAYPDGVDRAIALGTSQMLWDRAEGAGYVRHVVSDPLPGTPEKQVLMHVAFGDWQVSELTAMVAARTMGVPIARPVTADGRSGEVDPGWGIDTLDYDTDTSALVIWDSGSDPIPLAAVPPSTSRDPHGDPRNDVEVRRQKAAFLFDGQLLDVCNSGPCTAAAR